MSWQILILINVVTYSIGVLLQRLIVKEDKADPIAFSILFQLLVGIIVGIYGFIFEDMSIPPLAPLAINLILMAVLWGLANIFNFSALKVTEASVFTIIFSTRGIFTTLASGYFLGEFLNSKQWLGSFFILLGIVLVSIKPKGFKFTKKELLSLLTAMAFGFANTNDRILLSSFNLYPYVSLAFIVPAFAVALYRPKSVLNIGNFIKKGVIEKTILVAVVFAASSLAYFKALQITPNSSQVASISVSGVILTVLLSIIFLKEGDRMPQKLLGSVASFVGLVLMG